MHPDLQTLLRFCDGELRLERRTAVEAHVGQCGSCSLELHRLRAAGRAVEAQRPLEEAAPEAGLAGVLESIRGLEARSAALGETVKRNVAREIRDYLGAQAATTMLQHASPGGRDLLPAVEPTLALFLGRKAASLLVSRIVETAIVRI
jgi:anti-sigma factor ChrR (cupin superfamily)